MKIKIVKSIGKEENFLPLTNSIKTSNIYIYKRKN